MTSSEQHIPVLKREVVTALNIQAGGVYVDATIGRCGHAQAIIEQLDETGRLIGFDRDLHAIKLARETFGEDSRVQLLHSEFSRMNAMLHEFAQIEKVDGIFCLLYTSPSPRDQRGSRMPSSA